MRECWRGWRGCGAEIYRTDTRGEVIVEIDKKENIKVNFELRERGVKFINQCIFFPK